jgi:hypothetical protein
MMKDVDKASDWIVNLTEEEQKGHTLQVRIISSTLLFIAPNASKRRRWLQLEKWTRMPLMTGVQ